MVNTKNILKSTTFLAILACWLWSTAFANVKIGLQYNAPFQFAGMRFMISGIILFIYFGKPKVVYNEFKAYWKFILLLSVVQFSAQYAFFYMGMKFVPGALGAMIIGSSPLFIAVVAHFSFNNDKMTPIKTGSIFIGIIGIAIITLGRAKVEIKNELELLGRVTFYKQYFFRVFKCDGLEISNRQISIGFKLNFSIYWWSDAFSDCNSG